MTLSINCGFDSGNIECMSAEDPGNIRLEIRKDNGSDFYQWFHYRLSGARGIACKMTIQNAEGAAYPKGWPDFNACASYDRETWFRVPTTYENGELVIQHTPEIDSVYYAYFAPYSMERHADMIADAAQSDLAELRILGETLDGRTVDCLSIVGEAQERRTIWVIARQHPGESMAEWAAEGLIHRLLDETDPVGRALRAKADFHIVPNMNPDGSYRGHLRTNAVGSNLNREWAEPSLEKSPEVLCVLNAMQQTGCDLFLDMHGDEAIPYNFIAGAEGAPGFSEKDDDLLQAYKAALVKASPDFQTKYGYPRNAPGKANMTIAGNAMFGYFGCLAMTLEMPFKDNADLQDEDFGWSPERSRHLGAANLDAMLAVMDQLR
ncbi:MAG: M14-type cytosolic carboxypeptidase [Pseudomonadota bacterium]